MLNARLYRTCWLVAGVALIVALLTLESPEPAPEAALPSTIDGPTTLELAGQLAAVAPERPPGSAAGLAAARWVEQQLNQVPAGRSRAQVQAFTARSQGDLLSLQNVYLAVPGVESDRPPPAVLVVAPRDTPPGVQGAASATAVMLRLAQQSATTRHRRPHIFVSTDGSTVGNAGIRWFLARFSAFPLAAAIVLDAPGDASGDRIHVWSAGRTDRQALRLARVAANSVERTGGRPEATPGFPAQLLRLAVPQTAGDQGPAIARGLPAVALSGRPESPFGGGPQPSPERLELVANAANDLLGALDVAGEVPAADAGVSFAGKRLRPTIVRLVLLLAALPLLVVAVDATARLRRARVPLGPGAAAVARRAAPLLAALAAAHLLALGGLLPGTAAGAPPLPAAAPFDALAGLGLALAAGAGALAWLWTRRRRRAGAPSEAVAALALLSGLVVVAWLVSPFALVPALPAAHAALVATAARRPWQVAGLALIALAPLVAVVVSVAGRIDANAAFAAWYLLETGASGARGGAGVLLAALLAACLWSLGAHVLLRARKGALAPAGRHARSGAAARRGRRGARRPPGRW